MAAFTMLVHEVVRRELGPAGFTRIVMQGRSCLRLSVSARPVPLLGILLPCYVEDSAESHRSITRRYVENRVALSFWRFGSLDALNIKLARSG